MRASGAVFNHRRVQASSVLDTAAGCSLLSSSKVHSVLALIPTSLVFQLKSLAPSYATGRNCRFLAAQLVPFLWRAVAPWSKHEFLCLVFSTDVFVIHVRLNEPELPLYANGPCRLLITQYLDTFRRHLWQVLREQWQKFNVQFHGPIRCVHHDTLALRPPCGATGHASHQL